MSYSYKKVIHTKKEVIHTKKISFSYKQKQKMSYSYKKNVKNIHIQK